MNKKVITAIALCAFLMLTLAIGCSTIPDEKEAMDFAREYTTHYNAEGVLQPVDQKERDEAYILFYSEKFADAVLKNDLKKAREYSERVTVFYAVNSNTPERDHWIGISKLVDEKKTEELTPIAQQIKAEFEKKKSGFEKLRK
jgi:hypothetical protein